MLKWSIPIGRILGIRLYLHWSLLVTLVLITVLLAGSILPAEYGGRATAVYWTVGALAAVVFVASLAAHEIAHSVVAVRHDVPVRRITLWLLGGVSELRGEPADPRTELKITLAGPLTSFAIGVVSTALAVLLYDRADPVVTGSLAWLGITNIVLAVFNLLPGAPLDGGRVLHAVLWHRSGDRLTAAVGAARSGRVLGLALVVVGAFQALSTHGIGGLWLMLLGWFLRNAADVELMSASMRHQLGDVRISQIMTASPAVAHADDDVRDFVTTVLPDLRHHTFPVVDRSGRPVAVLSLRDLTRARGTSGPIAGVAHQLGERAVVRPDERVEAVVATAVLRPGLDLIVVVDDDDRLIGIVTATDLRRVCERTSLGLPIARPSTDTG